MPTDRHLGWIRRNRQHRSSATPIGELARRYLGGLCFRHAEDHGRIAEIVEAALGSSLARHCTVGEYLSGIQVIYVDDTAVLYHLHREAREVVLQALAAGKSRPKVRGIRFLLLPDSG